MNISIKKGDNVVVITGKDKGKTGKVLEVFPENNRVLVDGVNIVTKHKKARNQQEKSGIVKKSLPIDASNVMVVCPSCGKATRVGHKVVDGKKVRVCKCGVSLDKAYVKPSKKDAKKEAKKVKEEPVKEVKKETKAAAANVEKKPEAKTAKKPAAKTEKTTKTVKTEEKTTKKPVEKKTTAQKSKTSSKKA